MFSRGARGKNTSGDDDHPIGYGEPEDIANLVLFLASDESRFINGAELMIDNALTINP